VEAEAKGCFLANPNKRQRKGFIMEEYLTTTELSQRIKMAPGTIRNLVWKREFRENTHYLKPTRRKLLFVWSQVEAWLHRNSFHAEPEGSKRIDSLINI
jgi:hypothetical protein